MFLHQPIIYLQIVLEVAEGAQWVPGEKIIKIQSKRLLLFLQQILTCHTIIPWRSPWETKAWQCKVKFQFVKNQICEIKRCGSGNVFKGKKTQTFVFWINVFDVDLQLLLWDLLQRLLPGHLLSLFHLLFTLSLKVESKPFWEMYLRVGFCLFKITFTPSGLKLQQWKK